jgi:hypothetical protein
MSTSQVATSGVDMNGRISPAKEDHEIQSCYQVMAQLRPYVGSNEFS